jgi:hypothetical protein
MAGQKQAAQQKWWNLAAKHMDSNREGVPAMGQLAMYLPSSGLGARLGRLGAALSRAAEWERLGEARACCRPSLVTGKGEAGSGCGAGVLCPV